MNVSALRTKVLLLVGIFMGLHTTLQYLQLGYGVRATWCAMKPTRKSY